MLRHLALPLLLLTLALPLCAQKETKPLDNTTRETMEWCNMWWDHAPDTTLPRVLLMGDSIANQYSAETRKRLAGKANVDLLATSKSMCDPALLREVETMVTGYNYKVIHFNNGLHGFHLSDADYEAGLRRLIGLLQKLQPQAKLLWANCTPVVVANDVATLSPGNATVLRRNATAAPVMAELGIPITDLYSISVDHPEYRNNGDGYHYNQAGKVVQAELVAKVIADALQTP